MAKKVLTPSPRKTPRSRTPQVLEAAVAIFAEKGYESTSMQEIGETLGLLKGSIYYYVDSKEELLFSVIKAVHSEMMANLELAKARQGEGATELAAFIQDLIELTLDRLEHARVFQSEFRHLSDQHRVEISRERRQYEEFFQALLTEGQREGRVRTDIDVQVLSVAGLTMVTSIPTWYRRTGKISRRDVVSNYTALLMSAYAPPGP
jgi:AcrR family transcriptional regulator